MNKLLGAFPQKKYSNARWILLGIIAFTVINCLLTLIESDTYYVVSVYGAYLLFSLGYYTEFYLLIVLAVLVLALYTVTWLLSKKHGAWMIVALVLFCIDTAVLALFLLVNLDDAAFVFSLAIDLIFHGLGIAGLAIGVKNRRLGTMSDEEIAAGNTAAGEMEARISGQPVTAGAAPEVSCSVSLTDNGKPGAIQSEGALRFEPEELVVGMQNAAMRIMVGALFAGVQEKARFAYSEIAQVSFTNKRCTSFRMDLADGRILIAIVPTKANRDRLLRLLAEHGVTVPEPTA